MDIVRKYADLPAAEIAERVNAAVREHDAVVVSAPPGAGKSTLLPLTILAGLDQVAGQPAMATHTTGKPENTTSTKPTTNTTNTTTANTTDTTGKRAGKILMLEPRRIAARAVAERMSQMIGEPVGRTVGYRMRGESRTSAATRIEVLTEGILAKMMISDPTLDGVAAIIFDEFHERSINCDVALALARETRDLVRPDLKLIIMSATIDAQTICAELDAPLIESRGRLFPVEIRHTKEDAEPRTCAEATARAIYRALCEQPGDILAFLPGESDIRRCQDLLEKAVNPDFDIAIYPLYGRLPFEQQRKAIMPGPKRRVVLATPVAETSLTIEGVRTVVDSGFCRKQIFDPQSSLGRLETVRISLDMANQRSGRAGRLAPGTCIRLWTDATEKRMEASRKPEILETDLAPAVLDIAAWGESDPARLPWMTTPPREKLLSANSLLRSLNAIGEDGSITPHGRELDRLPCHPRLAQMYSQARTPESKALAEAIADLLEDRDPAPNAGADICEHLRYSKSRSHRGGQNENPENSSQIGHFSPNPYTAGALIAAAWPERIARARTEGLGHFVMAGGGYASLDPEDPLAASEWIAIASVNQTPGREGRIFLAAPLVETDLAPYIRERERVAWDTRSGSAVAAHEKSIGAILIESKNTGSVPRERIVEAICEAARKEGLSMLDFGDEVQNLQRRIGAVSAWHPELNLPDVSTPALLERAPEWLPPFVGKATTTAELRKIDICPAIWAQLSYEQQQAVDRLAPSHIAVPTGSRIKVEYRQGAELPVLRVRLQECFGMEDTPRVDGGRLPVLMELLSPGFKPVQLTADLRSFWSGTYFEVRSELRRRYPRHSWPDNPLEAEAVRGVRKKQ